MLKHIVLFKFKPEAADHEIEVWVESLQDLSHHIDTIRLWEIGREIAGRSSPNCDVCLISGFDTEVDLQRYDGHPAHQPILAAACRLCSTIVRTNYWSA